MLMYRSPAMTEYKPTRGEAIFKTNKIKVKLTK